MKQFLVILGVTAFVWLGVSMAEPIEYPVRVQVETMGYDTVRYAVVKADTALTLRVKTDGYRALLYSLRHETPVLKVAVADEGLKHSIPAADVYELLKAQMYGVISVGGNIDSLRIVLAERHHRSFRPRLDKVEFSFAEQYGLYGQPEVTPSEVILYGTEESLAGIEDIFVAKASVKDISASGSYLLPLEAVWESRVDVKPSCREVSVYVPVEAYVERDYRVPIKVLGADSTVEMRVYPDEAVLHVWVAQCDLHRTPEFSVAIDYSDVLAHKELVPRVVDFPGYVRLRSVEPKTVQCVIIK